MHRYAIYFAPRPGSFADRAAHWLGRDATTGACLPQPTLPGLPSGDLAADPRRYGFHGTIRAPFRAADGVDRAQVEKAVAALAARLQPVICEGLQLENLHGFLALTPMGCAAALMTLAAEVVKATNPLRAPLSPAETARRHPETLTSRQHSLLEQWGYPFVMEEFRFHLTLTDRLSPEQAPAVTASLQSHFAPVLPQPFAVEDLCLFGEDDAGLFHLLHRYALIG